MIVKTLPELVLELTKKSEKVNLPSLYQRYLEGELKRQRLKKRIDLLIKPEKRFEIMEEIALELYLTNSSALSSNQIRKLSGKMPTGEQLWEMENLREIVTCSFLIRRGNDYSFSHQSFLEYLVARRLAKDIVQQYLISYVKWSQMYKKVLSPLPLTIQR